MAAPNPKVYFDMSVGGAPAGHIVMELFADVTPKTTEVARCARTRRGRGGRFEVLRCRSTSTSLRHLDHRRFSTLDLRSQPPQAPLTSLRLLELSRSSAHSLLSVSMCLSDSTRTPGFEGNTSLNYIKDQTDQFIDETMKSHTTVESTNRKVEMNVPLQEEDLKPKRYAKIHDFCLGIPFGGIVFGGGLVGFLFSRNPASLTTGGLLGVAIMAMGVLSLKVWRQGLSSLPFMLGQAALAATFLWKHLQVYSLTNKIFPSGFYVAMSAAMLCFYSYVLISGGNPPPKKKPAAVSLS